MAPLELVNKLIKSFQYDIRQGLGGIYADQYSLGVYHAVRELVMEVHGLDREEATRFIKIMVKEV